MLRTLRPFLYLVTLEGYFNMKPDNEDYYTTDEAALIRAGIPISLCNEVAHAKAQNLPEWQKAETYLIQLRVAIAEGIIQPASPEFIKNDPDMAFICSGTKYVSRDILNNWPEVDYPPDPKQKQKALCNTDAPKSVYLMLALLIKELGFYEKYNEKGLQGGQDSTIKHIQDLAIKLGLSDKNLSRTTIQRHINKALNALKEVIPIQKTNDV